MNRWPSKLTLLFAALCIFVHAQCIASCSMQPCGLDPKTAKLPPCHRKHLPNSHVVGDPCSQAMVARTATPASSDQPPAAAWLPAQSEFGHSLFEVVGAAVRPQSHNLLNHQPFSITVLRV